jgi:hypothetical protein
MTQTEKIPETFVGFLLDASTVDDDGFHAAFV